MTKRRSSSRLSGAATTVTNGEEKPPIATESPTRKPPKKRKLSTSSKALKTEDDVEAAEDPEATAAKEDDAIATGGNGSMEAATAAKKTRKPRKKKLALEDEVWPERHWNSRKFVGAHVSSAGGADNSPLNACRIGAAAFALFLKSQRQWTGPPISEHTIAQFPLFCDPLPVHSDSIAGNASSSSAPTSSARRATPKDGRGYDFDRVQHVVPHGCYLVNLANPDQQKWDKAYAAFVEELQRAEMLGIGKSNFHPGSTTGACSREEGIALIAKGINMAHGETRFVRILIENMAGKGNMIGGTFADLRDIIALVTDKSRVGVCFDTCHAFASGYDLRTKEAYEAAMTDFGATVGFNYLGAVHVNDSKADFGSHRDLHENIGLGKLGLMPFLFLMNDPRFDGIPLILETPMLSGTLDPSTEPGGSGGVWVREIRMLHLMEGRTGNGDLVDIEEIRDEIQVMVEEQERKEEEERKLKGPKGKAKKGKVKGEDDGEAGSELMKEDGDIDGADAEEGSKPAKSPSKRPRSPKKVKIDEAVVQTNGTGPSGTRSGRTTRVTTYTAKSDSELSSLSV